jgi:hypothetical protein
MYGPNRVARSLPAIPVGFTVGFHVLNRKGQLKNKDDYPNRIRRGYLFHISKMFQNSPNLSPSSSLRWHGIKMGLGACASVIIISDSLILLDVAAVIPYSDSSLQSSRS